MITAAAATIKSYFLVIVALASIAGSALAVPYISNITSMGSSDSSSSSILPDASAQSIPYRVDHHLKVKERVGDPVRVEENINDGEQHCEMSCKYIEYKPGARGRAGLAFITDTPADLSGAKRVHFFLMGENGGETVKVKIAGKNPQNDRENTAAFQNGRGGNAAAATNTTRGPPQDADNLFKEKFGVSSNVITLPNDWQRFEVPLDGVDLKNIVAPFGIELLKGKGSAPQVVYLKYIVYDNQPADERFLLAANATTANATTANATTAANNTTAVESNNTIAQDDETVEETENTSNRTIADTPEGESDISDNTGNETTPLSPTTPSNNSNAHTSPPTPSDQAPNTTDTSPPSQGPINENLAPIATLAVDRMVAHPGDTIILDGGASSDPDGNEIITYSWRQSDGPSVDIINADTATPTVTIPTMERDDTIAIDLVVSDGQTESNRASVVIEIQYLEEIEGALQQDLLPVNDFAGEGWSDAGCVSSSDLEECLTDGAQSSFVSSDRPGLTTDLLFSFQDPSAAGINGSNNIAYVTAQVIAKKTGASGFISLIADNPNNNEHYSTPSISIVSDSFEQYSFTWSNNPSTGEPWTVDSLNSFIAGYRYLAGQGSIQVSEFKLIVSSLVPEAEEQPIPPSSPATDGESSVAEEPEAEEDAPDDGADQGNSDDAAPEEEEQEQPAPVNNGDDEAEEDGDNAGSDETGEEVAADDDNNP
ncbi:MAG: hypothetical protein M3115_05220 [Thermoproteota archaeon]|nr:hypothetical protein [Thermoproteota archaeon]